MLKIIFHKILSFFTENQEKEPKETDNKSNMNIKKQSKRDINSLIVHCSASPNDWDIGAKEIKELHTSSKDKIFQWGKYEVPGREWSDIGYHYVIRRDGTLEEGRPVERMGAHVKGHNKHSIGIVMVGLDEYTDDQFLTLEKLLIILKNMYNVEKDNILGHNDLNPKKSCPNINMKEFVKRL